MAPRNSMKKVMVSTRDGWRLALYRSKGARPTSRFGPVLLVHGLGANRYNLDAPIDEISLGAYLRERGHDVWVVELRGAGKSRMAGWPLTAKRPWDFDDYVQKDVPPVVRHILDETKAEGLHWVGHSMGGMIAYAALMHFDQRLFRSVTAIGSPVFVQVKHRLLDYMHSVRGVLNFVDWLPYAQLGWGAAIAPRLAVKTLGALVANPEELDPEHMRVLGPKILHDLPSSLVKQFAEWYGSKGGFSRIDGMLGYWEHLDRIMAPLQVVAGPMDHLSPPAEVRGVFEQVGSRQKKLVIAGKEQGFSADYGHLDLVLGRSARREIFPLVSEWIESHVHAWDMPENVVPMRRTAR